MDLSDISLRLTGLRWFVEKGIGRWDVGMWERKEWEKAREMIVKIQDFVYEKERREK